MKKVLINIILLFTFSISGMAQIEYGKTVEISKEVLLDKIKGGWAGQTIGCTYGGPTEFKYRGAPWDFAAKKPIKARASTMPEILPSAII